MNPPDVVAAREAEEQALERAWGEYVDTHPAREEREAFEFGWRAVRVTRDAEIAGLVEAIRDVQGKLRPVPGATAYRQIHSRHLRQLDAALRPFLADHQEVVE